MKFVAKLLLIILFVPLTVAVVLVTTVRLQLLDTNFWKNTFKNNNVYTQLSIILKQEAENQTEKGGGKKSDLKVITDVITPEILEDFISRNVDNVLGFANGKRKDLIVYLPINKIPKEFAPKSVGLNSEEIALTALLSKFNITVGQDLPISQVAYFGTSVNYSFVGLLALSTLCLFLLFVLTESKKKFVAPGLALLLSGLVILGVTIFGFAIKNSMLTDWIKGVEPSQIVLSTFAPYILQQIINLWTTIGIIMLILGVILFFVKKPHEPRQI